MYVCAMYVLLDGSGKYPDTYNLYIYFYIQYKVHLICPYTLTSTGIYYRLLIVTVHHCNTTQGACLCLIKS